MLALVARKLSGRFECGTGFIVTAELAEQITADAAEEMIGLERGFAYQAVHDRQRRFRSLGHADGNGAVEFNDRRTNQSCELRIKRGYAQPVGLLGRPRLRMAGNDRRLQRIEAAGAAEATRARQRLHAPPDLQLVPERAVLVEHQDGLA